ncbi:MAG: Fic family protein [Alphaproteobacteria bacterium]|nr:Fic family protein [Alphaproteobacteria bacterium]
MTKEERIARIKENKEEYKVLYESLKDRNTYFNWLQKQMVSTSSALERCQTITRMAKQMGVKDEDIQRVYELEDSNHFDAFNLMVEAVAMNIPLSEMLIFSLHREVLKKINDYEAGFYRRDRVRLLNSSTILPSATKVPGLMERLVRDYEKTSSEIVLQAFNMHHQFVSIHPFADGNGRTGRLLMNFHLLKHAYFPVVIHPHQRSDYLDSLEALSVKEDRETYHSFMLSQMESTFTECMDKMITLPRIITSHSMFIVGRYKSLCTQANETQKIKD